MGVEELLDTDDYWMGLALEQAHRAEQQDEVPVGAVIVRDGQCIARAYNQCITNNDPSAHAEIQAVRAACQLIGNYRLIDATLYVTLEPCCMCAGCLVHARIKRVVYATPDPKAGAAGSVFNLVNGYPLNHKVATTTGILQQSCTELLKNFFKARRR